MAAKKTSAEEAREQAEEAALGSMLDGAFGAMEGIEQPAPCLLYTSDAADE